MDVIEAIRTRKSVRGYKPDPVPREILTRLLETCIRAPSWENIQPWEFAIVGGKAMDELKQALIEKMASIAVPNPEIPFPILSEGIYKERTRDSGRRLFQALGIAREDWGRRTQWYLTMTGFFGAPNGIIFYIDRSLSNWQLLDMGILLQTIMLAAHNYGLGTCIEAAVVVYPDVLRKVLHIPDSKLIVCGMAIGYPEPDAPENKFLSSRELLETFATWHGI